MKKFGKSLAVASISAIFLFAFASAVPVALNTALATSVCSLTPGGASISVQAGQSITKDFTGGCSKGIAGEEWVCELETNSVSPYFTVSGGGGQNPNGVGTAQVPFTVTGLGQGTGTFTITSDCSDTIDPDQFPTDVVTVNVTPAPQGPLPAPGPAAGESFTAMTFSNMGVSYNAANQTVSLGAASTLTAGTETYTTSAVCNGTTPSNVQVTGPLEPDGGSWTITNSSGAVVATGGVGNSFYNFLSGATNTFGYVCQGTTHQAPLNGVGSYTVAGTALSAPWPAGTYTVNLVATPGCVASVGETTCSVAPPNATWNGTFVIPPTAPAVGTITVTSQNSQIPIVGNLLVPAQWALVDGTTPVCTGTACQGTEQTYTNQPAGIVVLPVTSIALLNPTNPAQYAFDSIKLTPASLKSGGFMESMLSLAKGVFGSTAEAYSLSTSTPSQQTLNASKTISYVILWNPIAAVGVSPGVLSLSSAAGTSDTGQVQVGNAGTPGSNLTWTTTITPASATWLSVSPGSDSTGLTNGTTGNKTENVTVTANSAGLKVGVPNTAVISFTGASSPQSSVAPLVANLTVTYTVTASTGGGGYSCIANACSAVASNPQYGTLAQCSALCPPPTVKLPTVTLSANPTSVASGQSTVLTWTSTNTTSCSLTGGGWTGPTTTGGTTTPSPITATTTYTAVCTGAGVTSQPQTVTVGITGGSQIGGSGFDCVANACTLVSSGAQYGTITDCAAACKTPSQNPGYDCVNNACSAVSSGAQYTTLSSCNTSCGSGQGGGSGYDCVNNACSAVSSGATYGTLSSCNTACSSGGGGTGGGYDCVNNACSAVTSNAQYGTAASCNISCGSNGGGSGYDCVNNACSAVPSNAQYGTAASCNTSCGQVGGAGYSCINNACSAVSSGAQYGTQASCNTSCGTGGPVVSVTPACNPNPIDTTQTSDCTATVAGGSGGGVTWKIINGPGSIATSTGVYTPPPSVSTSTAVTVQATSVQDPSKTQTTVITVNPVGATKIIVVCTPNVVAANGTSQCNATTTTSGGTPVPGGVVWTIEPGDGPGSISSSTGIYTAPPTITATTTVTITVTSILYPGVSTTVTITVSPPPTCVPGSTCPVCTPGLTASPSSIVVPESSSLSYSCRNVTQCQLTQGGTLLSSATALSAYSVTPTSTTAYTLACTNTNFSGPGSTISSTATVTVGGSSLCEQNPNGAGCPGQ